MAAQQGCLSRGVPVQGGVYPGAGVSVQGGVYHTPVNRMTDRCKNITFPQLRLHVVKMNFILLLLVMGLSIDR